MTKMTLIEKMRKISKFDFAVRMFLAVLSIIFLSMAFSDEKDIIIQSAVTIFGIVFALYMVSEQMDQLSRDNKRRALEEHANSASENVYYFRVKEGLIAHKSGDHNLIVSWNIEYKDREEFGVYNFYVFFKILLDSEDADEVIRNRGCAENFWDFIIIIPRIGTKHGVTFQIPEKTGIWNLESIEEMDDNHRVCILKALKILQYSDRQKLVQSCRNLHNFPLKELNDEIVKDNIFDYESMARRY